MVMAVETNVSSAVGGGHRLAVGRNTLILLVSNFSSAALGLVISILIARGAGDAALGTYSLALAWALTLAQFADLGMSTLLTRDLARTPQHTASYLRASLLAKTALGLVLTLGLVVAAPALASGGAGTSALQLGATMIVLNAWYTSFTAVFRAFGRMLPILVLNLSGLVLQSAVTWYLISIAAPVAALIALAAAIQALQVLAAWFIYARQIPTPHETTTNAWRDAWQYGAQLTRAGIPFAIAGILGSLELRANVFLLGALDGERAVGWYSAASRLNDGIRLAPNAFFGAILPALAALGATQNQQQLRQFFQKRAWALVGFGGAAALALTVLAPWLIPFLYGDAFAPAIPVLMVLGWGLIPALVTGLLILYLYARGDERFVNWLIGIGLVVQVAFALVLMRVYGAAGAAAASLLSDCVVWFLLRRRIAQLERGTQTNWRAFAKTYLPPVALFLLAALVRIIPVWQNSFDGLYGQDAYAYYDYARTLFLSLTHGQLPPPFFWSLGYPFLLNVGFLLGGVSTASAQTITIVCGALVAPAAFALAHQAAPNGYKNAAGWTAGLVCALSGQLVQSSVVIMSDAPALLFATLGAWLLLRYARTRQTITLSFAALAAGMAVWSRWQNLIYAAVWFAALLLIEWQFARQPRAAEKQTNPWLRAAATLVLALILIMLVLSPQTIIRSTTNPTPAGSVWLEGWSPVNFFARTFDNQDGHFDYTLPVALFYGQVFAHPAYLFALLTPLFLVGIAALLYVSIARTKANRGGGRNSERAWVAPVLLLGWILGNYLFLAGIPYQNFRFILAMLPPIAVLTGIGAGWLWHRWHSSRLRVLLVGWIALALIVMTLWQPRVLAPVLAIKAGELDQAQWVSQQLPPAATVWTLSLEGALKTYTTFSVFNIWEKSATELTASAPSYLLVDVSSLETQWRDKPVTAVFRSLRDRGQLIPLGSLANYSLFLITR